MRSTVTPADPPGPDSIVARLGAVRSRIVEACARCGREPSSVRLVAVSKTVSAERIRALTRAGHTLLGENRVQEALDKMSAVPDATWHFVGHLQRNKARHAAGRFELIHGVASEALARELDRRAAAAGVRQAVLVQVNLSGESTKSGAPAERTVELLGVVAQLPSLELRGLMTIPPPVDRAELARRWFRDLRGLRDRAETKLGRALPELSMGMTDDFDVAVEEGATLVRVGRALFGERLK